MRPRKRDGRLTKTGKLTQSKHRPLYIVLRPERFAASLPDLWHHRHHAEASHLGTMPDYEDTEPEYQP